ncbi:MAG: NAD(P)/FAD-dependent oxidoreductase [Acidimicrobiales bacterium]
MDTPNVGSVDVVVVGRGLLGSSAARHLTELGAAVSLVGPGEPVERRRHQGVFGSHYDSARITRVIDRDPYYARVSAESIGRYAEIEAGSGVEFFHPVGHVAVSPMAEYTAHLVEAARVHQLDYDVLDDAALAAMFPALGFGPGMTSVVERGTGGWIDPRKFIEAQTALVRRGGGRVIEETVVHVDSVTRTVTTDRGTAIGAEAILLATGAFAHHFDVIPEPIDVEVVHHTVVMATLAADAVEYLADMPSVIYKRGDGVGESVYVMPPASYPDGSVRIKIGQSVGHPMNNPASELIPWFQSEGDPEISAWLLEELEAMIPNIDLADRTTDTCVVTKSPTGRQFIDRFDGTSVYALLAANGQVAKSADELGRIAAHRVVDGAVPAGYADVDYGIRTLSR